MGYWLMKTEPEEFSYADLERRGREPWNGVRNPLALRHMRSMQAGDLALIYHTGNERCIVGIAQVLSPVYPDPQATDERLVVVDVAPYARLARPISLAEIKADLRFAQWELVRQSRLSVMPVSSEHWRELVDMEGSSRYPNTGEEP